MCVLPRMVLELWQAPLDAHVRRARGEERKSMASKRHGDSVISDFITFLFF